MGVKKNLKTNYSKDKNHKNLYAFLLSAVLIIVICASFFVYQINYPVNTVATGNTVSSGSNTGFFASIGNWFYNLFHKTTKENAGSISSPETPTPYCHDSDGYSIYTRGTCDDGTNHINHIDYCDDTDPSMGLTEYYCTDTAPAVCASSQVSCPGLCVNGACTNTTAPIPQQPQQPNSHSITIPPEPQANNSNNNTVPLPLTITPTSPQSITYHTGSIWFNVTLSNLGTSCNYSLDNGVNVTMQDSGVTTGPGLKWYRLSTVADGSHKVKFYCIDIYRQKASTVSRSFNVSTSSPLPLIITIKSPQSITYLTNTIWFNVSLSNPGAGCNYSLDNGVNVTMLSAGVTADYENWHKLSTVADGSHKVKFYCIDVYGQKSSTSLRTFTVNTTAPIIPCHDSDENNTDKQGTCTDYNGENFTDFCVENGVIEPTQVSEYSCDNLQRCTSYVFTCSYRCLNGACQQQHNETAVCGNGVKEAGEECDGEDGVPTSCDSGYVGDYWCDDLCELQNDCTRIGGGGCTESWSCNDWSECINNVQTRACTDANGCGTITYRPPLSQNCNSALDPCTENDWQCDSWSPCVDNQQTRNCAATRNCDASRGVSKETIQGCVSPNPANPKKSSTNWILIIGIVLGSLIVLAIIIVVIIILTRKKKDQIPLPSKGPKGKDFDFSPQSSA